METLTVNDNLYCDCRCGWLEHKTAYRVIQWPRYGCGTHGGVHKCTSPSQTTWNVYCFRSGYRGYVTPEDEFMRRYVMLTDELKYKSYNQDYDDDIE